MNKEEATYSVSDFNCDNLNLDNVFKSMFNGSHDKRKTFNHLVEHAQGIINLESINQNMKKYTPNRIIYNNSLMFHCSGHGSYANLIFRS